MNIICGWRVANSILKKSFNDKDNIFITPLKLNCLIYLLYSNYLYKTGVELFNESFFKTVNGPVLSSVEFKFGCFKNNVITKFAKDSLGKIFFVVGDEFEKSLSYIWSSYKYMDDMEILDFVNNMDAIREKRVSDLIMVSDILDDEIKRNNKLLENAKMKKKKIVGY